jgi:hypothetical protein
VKDLVLEVVNAEAIDRYLYEHARSVISFWVTLTQHNGNYTYQPRLLKKLHFPPDSMFVSHDY